jgi:hypothetical protein
MQPVDRSLDLKLGLPDRRQSKDLLIPAHLPAVLYASSRAVLGGGGAQDYQSVACAGH